MNLKVTSIEPQRRACYKYSDVCQTCVPLHLIRQGHLMSCGWKHKNSSSSGLCVWLHPASQMTPKRQEGNYLVKDVANICAECTFVSTKCLFGKITTLFPGLLQLTESEPMGTLSSLVFSDDRKVLAIKAPDINVANA